MKKLNTNLVKVANFLATGEYHDGDSIGRSLNITRSAVWKAIRRLKQQGVLIDAVKGKGYVLREPFLLLDAAAVRSALVRRDPALCKKEISLAVFETITSTNDYLLSTRQSGDLTVCLAEQQTGGKGRLGRQWHSPFGRNVYFSCRYRFEKDISELAGLSLVAGLAVARMLNEFTGADDLFQVKWPNDIYAGKRKVAGCLIEMQAEAHGACHVVIGIGINVNMRQNDGLKSDTWTSLIELTDQYFDRNEICARLIQRLVDYLERFAKSGLAPFISEWSASDMLAGKVVTIQRGNQPVTGQVAGVNENGYLLLQLMDGTVHAFSSGEATMHVSGGLSVI